MLFLITLQSQHPFLLLLQLLYMMEIMQIIYYKMYHEKFNIYYHHMLYFYED